MIETDDYCSRFFGGYKDYFEKICDYSSHIMKFENNDSIMTLLTGRREKTV